MSAPLTFHLLGDAALSDGDKPLADFRSRTAEALLIYLACHNRSFPRQFLADFFWDDRSQKQASANLRAVLSMLRKEVGDYLVTDRQTVAFNRKLPHWVDSAIFEERFRELEPKLKLATPLNDETRRQLEAAMTLYQGDFLAGFYLSESRGFEEWVVVVRERLRRLAALGLKRLVQHFLENGRYQEGVIYAERLLAVDPYNEEAQRRYMWLLLRSGNRNAALRSYRQFKELLLADLGVEPSLTTTAVFDQIASLIFPPPHNISVLSTPFIGREDEIIELKEQLLRPDVRLITLAGPGGIGKTRLAVQVAHQIATFQPGCFLDGVWFVPLAPIPSARFLVTAVAKVLGLTLRGTPSPRVQLLEYLQNREMLLILDNFEHLLVGEESGLELLSEILEQTSKIKLLVTTREQLNLREEVIFDVAGLPYPNDSSLPADSAVNFSSVALFLQGAKRALRGFAPGPEEFRSIIQLCRLLEGMPLALEMSAAWVRQLTVQEILTQLQHSFDSLETIWHNIPQRHRSLRAVFDHSWQLLTAEEQSGFTRLAVFQGGFSPAAALTVAGVSKPSLFQSKSLLRREEDGRFDMHSLIHQFSAELLKQDKSTCQEVQSGHAHYYLNMLHQQESLLVGETAEAAVQLVAGEIENIRLAWQWAVEQGRLGLLNKGYLSLYHFYEMQGWLEEGQSHFHQTVAALERQLAPLDKASEEEALVFGRLQAREGWFTYRIGQVERARETLERGERLFRRLGSKKDLAQSLNDLGLLARRHGDYAKAKALFLESLAVRREIGDGVGAAICLNNLANAIRFQGDYEQAKSYLLESLAILQEAGNFILLANVTNDLGETHRATGSYEEARKFYAESLAIRQKIGSRPGIAMCLNNLGSVAHTLGDYDSARRYAQESLAVDLEIGDKRAATYPLSVLGRIARDEGDYTASFASFRRALQICREIQYIPKTLDILFEMATVYEAMKRPEPAVRLLAFVIHHPKINHETKKAAMGLLERLGATLESGAADLLAQDGREDSLEKVVMRMLRGEAA